ncbi:MAG: citrate lyase holo-[acyl-carrier protein] synthase [Treponema sp.]|jgi:holo-ACP synthase/triphosphoribosyl-dephospho-CoA synthase|nr:citrate lyase holo-[acyl-carrier protein] synthase [Treponema sp.]
MSKNRFDYRFGAVPVSLEEVLAFREDRKRRQEELLAQFPPGTGTLVSLSLNIPGEYKHFPWALRAFREEMDFFSRVVRSEGIAILHKERIEKNRGYTGLMVAAETGERLKRLGTWAEERHDLGRLFDIDVLNSRGEKLSRRDGGGPGRSCLICGGDPFCCARTRAHSREVLMEAVLDIMGGFFRKTLEETIRTAAVKALLYEAAVSPKPGLVDRFHNGSHDDMDFFSFINSAAAITPFFADCAAAGFDYREKPEADDGGLALFESLRQGGKLAEARMREAASGANTHRGMIFSLGVISAAYGFLFHDQERPPAKALFDLCRSMTRNLQADFAGYSPTPSHGEAIYRSQGITGIRGEVSRGFPVVREYSLPHLTRMLEEGVSLNDAGILILLGILARLDDTNIIHRANLETLRAIQEDLLTFLEKNPDPPAATEKARQLDRAFLQKNISPGGSADLLGITFFLHLLCSRAASETGSRRSGSLGQWSCPEKR